MIEVELKVKAENLVQLERALNSSGAEFLELREQHDVYYNPPHRDFQAANEALRLRLNQRGSSAGYEYWLTYKGSKLDERSKSREEVTVGIKDWGNAQRLLQSLGFAEVGRVEKFRKTYRLEKFLLSLDEVTGLGSFLEVEAKAEDDYSWLLGEAFGLLESLGFGREDVIRESYLELLAAQMTRTEGESMPSEPWR